jgi:tetratricopeptide (TPR) repeat protein
VYTTGFSGGARVATLIAQMCKTCIAGVFAHGAGFPPNRQEPEKPAFVYFAAVGDLDFNYYELLELSEKLDTQGVPNRLRRYAGPHRWAPPEICMEAVEWFELMAMKQGRREEDSAFIARQFERASLRVRELDKAGDLYALWLELHKFAFEFDGLADVSAFARRAVELKDSSAVRDGARRERAAIEEQRRVVAPIADLLDALSADPVGRSEIRLRLSAQIADLLGQLKQNKDAGKGFILRRAQSELFAVAIETGQQKLNAKDLLLAFALFEVASELSPDSPAPFLSIARAQAQSGRKKETLRALQQALAKGFPRDSLGAFLRSNAEFAPFCDLPEFQSLLGATPERK